MKYLKNYFLLKTCTLLLITFTTTFGISANNPNVYNIGNKNHLISNNSIADKVTISGYIYDTKTGETLIGAVISALSQRTASTNSKSDVNTTFTNNFGFYTLTIPAGSTNIKYSYVGYEDQSMNIDLQRDTIINIHLSANMTLNEVVVTGHKEAGISSAYIGSLEIPLEQIKNAPAVFGEADILKTIQLMPGVQSGMEGTSGIYVRGGGTDENLMLLDGVSIYNVSHMLGLFSVFTPEAVKKVTMYKGSFPAKYSGRISSIVDVRTNDGNMKDYHGTVSTGLLSTKLHLEGPIKRERTSFSVSGRAMNTLFLGYLLKLSGANANYYFYDLNGKISHRINDNNRLFISAYNGLDRLKVKDNYKDEYGWNTGSYATHSYMDNNSILWGNTVISARWNHIFGNKIFSNTTVAYNRYNMGLKAKNRENTLVDGKLYDTYIFTSEFRSGIQDLSARLEFEYKPNYSNNIQFGAEYIFHDFLPETLRYKEKQSTDGKVVSDTVQNSKLNSHLRGHEISVYLEDNISFGNNFSLVPGIHLSAFITDGRTYISPEPRISAKYIFGGGFSGKIAYSRMAQYVHLLTSSQISLPTDLWVPITKNIKPVYSNQYSFGAYYEGLQGYSFSFEGYYKDMRNVLEYIDGSATIGKSSKWDERVEMGTGRAFGVELFAQKTLGETTGWVSYTLAKSDRQFKSGNISNGNRFPYKYDRRHNVSICVNHKFNDRVDIGATWIFLSGGTITVPERMTKIAPMTGHWHNTTNMVSYIGNRNNYRLPSTHRLNFGVNFRKKKQRGERIWNISIYNAYNALNPNIVYLDESYYTDRGNEISETRLEKITMLPFVPSFSYTYKF